MNTEKAVRNVGAEVVYVGNGSCNTYELGNKFFISSVPRHGYALIYSAKLELGFLSKVEDIELKGEPKMQNYKIKVSGAEESEEVQKLFFSLGCTWRDQRSNVLDCCKHGFLGNDSNNELMFWRVTEKVSYLNEEITLPQLRDLAVLHRNDVSDATHKCKNNDEKWFLTSDTKLYYFHVASNKWQPHGNTDTEVILKDYTVPITQEQRKDLNGNFTKDDLMLAFEEKAEKLGMCLDQKWGDYENPYTNSDTSLAYDLFKSGAQAQLAQYQSDDWISVSDRLPEDGQDVIAITSIVSCQFVDNEFLEEFYEYDTGHSYQEATHVTHWKPMSQVIKQEQHNAKP